MPNINCQLALKECLPCNDSPIANLSAEEPDVDVFIAFRDFKGNPPLGIVYGQLACKSICFSTVSQQAADDCALRQAQECVYKEWKPPQVPPIPPGPNNTGGKGSPANTPGGVPPNNPRFPVRRFFNSRQTCDQPCPDGTPFTSEVASGTVVALSQALADEQAKSLACKRALERRLCFATLQLPGSCIEEAYLFQLVANGGTTFDTHDYDWVIESGSLPPGVDLDPDIGLISGLPLVSGRYTFTVRITDAIGTTQSKEFTLCIMEIVTLATLPNATEETPYSTPLVQQPGTVSSEVWTLLSGSLPEGLSLAANGVISGTPTDLGMSEFTLQVQTDCGVCSKTFNLEVVNAVDCMGLVEAVTDCSWTDVSTAGCSMSGTGGDGVWSMVGVLGPPPQCQVLGSICNPSVDAYAFTVNITGNGTTGGAGSMRCIFRLDGVDHLSPDFPDGAPFNHTFNLTLNSGAHPPVNGFNLRIQRIGGGFAINTWQGAWSIRPLTPP